MAICVGTYSSSAQTGVPVSSHRWLILLFFLWNLFVETQANGISCGPFDHIHMLMMQSFWDDSRHRTSCQLWDAIFLYLSIGIQNRQQRCRRRHLLLHSSRPVIHDWTCTTTFVAIIIIKIPYYNKSNRRLIQHTFYFSADRLWRVIAVIWTKTPNQTLKCQMRKQFLFISSNEEVSIDPLCCGTFTHSNVFYSIIRRQMD